MNFRVAEIVTTIMDKSLGFSNSQRSNPSPHLTNNIGREYPEQNFFRVSTLYRLGGRENCTKISKMIHCFKREPRNNRKIGMLQYCPKDFCPGLHLYYLLLEKNGLGKTPQCYCTSLHT